MAASAREFLTVSDTSEVAARTMRRHQLYTFCIRSRAMLSDFYTQQFIEAIDQCRRVYVDKVIECYLSDTTRFDVNAEQFFEDLEHRFSSLIIKAFVETVESDLILTPAEGELVTVLVRNLLKRPVLSRNAVGTINKLSELAKQTEWKVVLEPLTWFEELEEFYEEVKSGVLKIANLVSKVDGNASVETISQLKMLRLQLDQYLVSQTPVAIAATVEEEIICYRNVEPAAESGQAPKSLSGSLIAMLADEKSAQQARGSDDDEPQETMEDLSQEQRDEKLREGMEELESLIGISEIREEVRTLINVCKLQQFRATHSMPTSSISLHMVFAGNPGTGKTTVARIVGKLFGAIGVIKKGHLVETDRSGLVAEFQGQTATKTNDKINEALDGVLFIDEAYSLAPEGQSDSYGQEAIQTLLKRMEDDRDRLVVILAGYPEPMNELLKVNPGLSSRFSRRCHFPDYGVDELIAIFGNLASKNHYQMDDQFRSRLREEIQEQVENKDEHFGNGRLVRNLFEHTMRNMANRIVMASDLTPELLSKFHADDLDASEF